LSAVNSALGGNGFPVLLRFGQSLEDSNAKLENRFATLASLALI